MNILALNCGSSSIKCKLVAPDCGDELFADTIERVRGRDGRAAAIQQIVDSLGGRRVDAVGHRVVHGGERFTDAVEIDEDVIQAIEECVPLAPIHNPVNLDGIRIAREVFPGVPHVAVFDTAFHHTLPRRARHYAVDAELAERLGIRRYGFHGISHAFVAGEAARALDTPLNRLRLVTCHLGSGASVCAVEYGHSVETSMGMTPLEGLVMGTRCGDLDPGAVIALLRDGRTADEVDRLLNRESGLLGLSGGSSDLRDIEGRAAAGDARARLAVSVFAHRVRKYIGAYAAIMGGVDAIVLTGGIGENAPAMRARILHRFGSLGLILDEDRNLDTQVSEKSRVAEISTPNSRIRALVVATDEELSIAREAAKVVVRKTRLKQPDPIPVAVSARHVHLTPEIFSELFGPDAKLTVRNELSQPGQFAAEETVSLIGPRHRIDGVRILGPFRGKCQAEISRTDEFFLGVDAPVRASGHTEGSAPITVEGPRGTVHLSEGLICALRHIHMEPEDAAAYGVDDGDEVEVGIGGGPRDLIFGDVLVRVSPRYRLEMHIDTDEANAAEVSSGAHGVLERVEGCLATMLRRRPTEHPS